MTSPVFRSRPPLALFYYWGSSQSRESDDRIAAKIDALLRERNLDPDNP